MTIVAGAGFFKPDWQVPVNIEAVVTTCIGGVSKAPYQSMNLALHVGDAELDVVTNRQLLAREFEANLQWQWLEQVHSANVVKVNRSFPNLVADGLITSTPGIACCVLTADCLSVFFAADDGSEIAVAHAGWRGLASGILLNTIRGMSVPASQLHVWLGPAIGACHFEVGAEVRDVFLAAYGKSVSADTIETCFHPIPNSSKYMADLPGLARMQLLAAGVANVSGGKECTYCLADKYYSYRRTPVTGRQLSMIYLKSTD